MAVRARVRSALDDLSAAQGLLRHRDKDGAPYPVAFHAQQAAEKAIKAQLISRSVDFPPRHDLSLLVGLLPTPLKGATRHTAADLTKYAVEPPEPDSPNACRCPGWPRRSTLLHHQRTRSPSSVRSRLPGCIQTDTPCTLRAELSPGSPSPARPGPFWRHIQHPDVRGW